MEALLSDPNREIICVTLLKFNAKAKSFHVAVRGNFPAARGFAKPDTYTTTRRRAVGNESSSKRSSESSSKRSSESSSKTIIGVIIKNGQSEESSMGRIIRRFIGRFIGIIIGIISGNINPNRQTINALSTGHRDIESTTTPLRAIDRAFLRAIRQASRHHGAANDPNGTPHAEPTPRYTQAVGPPPGLRRTNRRDTRKWDDSRSGRRRKDT